MRSQIGNNDLTRLKQYVLRFDVAVVEVRRDLDFAEEGKRWLKLDSLRFR
jgi:hypothetical protein